MQITTDKNKFQPNIISKWFPCILGICALAFGIICILKEQQKTAGYETIQGYCSQHVYSYTNDDGQSYYKWTYSYTVDGKEYSITTDFNANFSPAIGSTRTIKYNPLRPEEAFIPNLRFHHVMILGGIIMTAIALIDIFNTYVKYCPVNLCGIVKGIAFTLLGFGINYILSGNFSLLSTYASFHYIVIFPAVFIAVGICVAIRSLFRKMGNKEITEDGWISMKQ